MVRTLLIRGMLVGAAAGILAGVFAFLFGEPPVDAAIAYEEQLAAASGAAEPPVIGRGVQRTVGLAVGLVAYGVALGGLYSLVYATVSGRFGRLGPRATAALLALVGFLVVVLVPFLKYPANPPASSLDDTVGDRSSLYWIMLLASVLVACAAVQLGRRWVLRHGLWNATLLAAGGYLAVIAAIGLMLPAVAETPAGFPATVLYEFRIASLGTHLVLWTVLGLLFGARTERGLRRSHPPAVAAVG